MDASHLGVDVGLDDKEVVKLGLSSGYHLHRHILLRVLSLLFELLLGIQDLLSSAFILWFYHFSFVTYFRIIKSITFIIII